MITSMMCGVVFYQPLSVVDDLAYNIITPALIFLMLFVTFCRVRLRDLHFSRLHIWLILFQVVMTPLSYYLFLPFGELVAQGAMVCFMAPVAMAAVAVGALLGGNVMTIAGYTLVCNFVIAFFAPYILDIYGSGECTLTQILMRVVPLLLAPLAAAQTLKRVWKRAADWISKYSQMSFYMWLCSMAVTLARTTGFVIDVADTITLITALTLSGVALFACVTQYYIGHRIGVHYNDSVAATQSLGQKNTILAVWLAQSFLNPVSSIAPTAYIIWQNLVNSFQLYRHDRRG